MRLFDGQGTLSRDILRESIFSHAGFAPQRIVNRYEAQTASLSQGDCFICQDNGGASGCFRSISVCAIVGCATHQRYKQNIFDSKLAEPVKFVLGDLVGIQECWLARVYSGADIGKMLEQEGGRGR